MNLHNIVKWIMIAAVAMILLSMGIRIASVGDNNITVGVNGLVETRCISGYTFLIGVDGRSTQVLSELGRGVPCEKRKD